MRAEHPKASNQPLRNGIPSVLDRIDTKHALTTLPYPMDQGPVDDVLASRGKSSCLCNSGTAHDVDKPDGASIVLYEHSPPLTIYRNVFSALSVPKIVGQKLPLVPRQCSHSLAPAKHTGYLL